MYIFGGRTEEGADLGDLAAFRISSRRWYTFQNMGPSPSPRSGHSMTTVGKSVVVVGGEPSSAATAVNDLGLVYLLDTSKIRYPNDSQAQANAQKTRRPSQGEVGPPSRQGTSRDGSQGPSDTRRGAPRDVAATDSPTNGYRSPNGGDYTASQAPVGAVPKPPRNAAASPPAGPPPQGQPPKPTIIPPSANRSRNASTERGDYAASPASATQNQSPVTREMLKEVDAPTVNGRRTPTQQQVKPAPRSEPPAVELPKPKPSRQQRAQGSVDSSTEPALKTVTPRPASPPPPTRQTSNPLNRRSSGRNSQTVALLKELDSARNRNAWYASELELARKGGYIPNASFSPVLDSHATETFDDDDKPLIEALLAMRTELANVQSSVDKQAVLAAKQIAEAEKQRDAAIQEAVYAKAKLAAHGGSAANTPQPDDRDDDDRFNDISRKLAYSLNTQKDLHSQLERVVTELDAEKKARKLADDTASAAEKRSIELESYKQQTSSEVERLKAELHLIQREAREQAVTAAEAVAASQLLQVAKNELQIKFDEAVGSSKEHSETFDSLREALTTSTDMKSLLERKLDEERQRREAAEAELSKLKTEHEARNAEIASINQRLKDAQELAEQHANEARTHKQAVLAGLEKMTTRDVSAASKGDNDRIIALQGQLSAANALVKRYQQEADAASDRLRSAEERIAGLEAYQEQTSRDGVTIRRQLQAAMRETQSLQAHNSDLKNQLANQQLETNAMAVQHSTLKSILSERGISPTSAARARGSPREMSPGGASRVRDLEQQLAASIAAHEETKQLLAAQAQESEGAYRDKLAQLENDYQSAVHYVKGTEKMLKQLKEQLARYKADNTRLKAEVEELEEKASAGASREIPAEWEGERKSLMTKVESLQSDVKTTKSQLESQIQAVRKELDEARRERDMVKKSQEENTTLLKSSRKDLEQLRQENALLEQRAQDAEQKVSLLLDQVEHSVDTYRRRSRNVVSMTSDQLEKAGALPPAATPSTNGQGHHRQESSEAGSLYGGMSEARNSTALDNLANELETLRSHWEATNKNYRLSNTFDFDNNVNAGPGKKGGDENDPSSGLGLSESLADWRKRLDD